MNYRGFFVTVLFGGSILAQGGGTQAPSPEQVLSALSKEQLIELIQVLSTMQQQKAVPTVQVAPVVVATPALAALALPNPGADCAHFVTDLLSQVVTIAIAQDPLVTVNGVTNIVHHLISLMVQQHQRRSLPIIQDDTIDDEQELSRYELLKGVLAELEELMEELQDIDRALLELTQEN